MRTAVCLSGQARFIEKNSQSLLDNIIGPTSADVFCHFWDTSGENIEYLKALEIFQPVDFTIEPQRYFDTNSFQFIRPEYAIPLSTHRSIHSMYYSIYQANLLKQKYEKDQQFSYDCVIRSRTDLSFDRIFYSSEFESNKDALWVCNFDRSPAGNSCADLFAFSTSELMDVYSDCFNHLPGLLEEKGHCYAETLLYDYLTPRCAVVLSEMRYKIVGK